MIKIWIKLISNRSFSLRKFLSFSRKFPKLSRKLSLNNNFISLIMIWLIFSSTTMVVVIIEIIDSDTTLMIVCGHRRRRLLLTNQPTNQPTWCQFFLQPNQSKFNQMTDQQNNLHNKNRSKTRLASCIHSWLSRIFFSFQKWTFFWFLIFWKILKFKKNLKFSSSKFDKRKRNFPIKIQYFFLSSASTTNKKLDKDDDWFDLWMMMMTIHIYHDDFSVGRTGFWSKDNRIIIIIFFLFVLNLVILIKKCTVKLLSQKGKKIDTFFFCSRYDPCTLIIDNDDPD